MYIITTIQQFLNNLNKTLVSIIKIVLLSKVSKFPKNKLGSDSCIILGNGPSLKSTVETNPNFIKNKTLIAVNHFAETELYSNLKPEIYILSAPEMWKEDVEVYHKNKGKKLFEAISKNTNWNIKLFILHSVKKNKSRMDELKKNSNISIFYFNPTGIEGFNKFCFYCFAKGFGIPRPHNVLIPSLIISIMFKFSTIFIAGADHNWIKNIYVTRENKVLLTQKHFYDEKTAKPRTMDKMGKGERKLHEILEKFVISLKGYFIIGKFAKKNKIKIYNITPDSYIDAFEKLNLNNE
ncbi:MAG: hypothetical protein L3J35_11630 [Bacteroidales bacterium]|nr:hypothetical protein [Bacteroidales bacterium]